MRESSGNIAQGARMFSARRMALLIMLACVAIAGLWDGMDAVHSSWEPQSLAPRKADEIVRETASELDAVPEGATLLVLVNAYDFRELAYASYHQPAYPGAPEKLPLVSPEHQTAIPFRGRYIMVAACEPLDDASIAQAVGEFNSRRTSAPIFMTVAFTWRVENGIERIETREYDENGKRLK